jgi:hypothetical protein
MEDGVPSKLRSLCISLPNEIAPGGVKFLSQPHPLRQDEAAGSLLVGTWLSLVEHSLGVRGVGSSNLPVPTNKLCIRLRDYEDTNSSLLNR